MILTRKNVTVNKKELKSHEDAEVCYISGRKFRKKFAKEKVRDYCHYTGKYRGAPHSICSLKFHMPNGMR